MTGIGSGDARVPVGGRIRRAAAFAAVGSLALGVPIVGDRLSPPMATAAAVGPFLVIAAVALYGISGGALFEVFARPGDRKRGRLYGLAGFSLAIAGLALFATRFGMPATVFVGSVLVVIYGNLAEQLMGGMSKQGYRSSGMASGDGGRALVDRESNQSTRETQSGRIGRFTGWAGDDPLIPVGGFTLGGAVAALVGVGLLAELLGMPLHLPLVVFLAVAGSLIAALLRTVLFRRDDPLVLLSIGLILWLLADVTHQPAPARVGLGLALAVGFGALAYLIGAASVTGMLTGVVLALMAVVLGGYGWFAVLVSFFGLGGLVSKYRYEEKLERGVAQENAGARSSGNVLGNASAALVALLGFAASGRLGIEGSVFLFAFTGSVAAAMSDTFSSEIGGLYDRPRLVTSFEVVAPGTDGGVTWQGMVAGCVGAVIIAGVGLPFFDLTPLGVMIVVVAGIAGMTVDSLLGATLEGQLMDNQGVNLASTFAAALLAGGLALALGP